MPRQIYVCLALQSGHCRHEFRLMARKHLEALSGAYFG